ncbi:uncharacterized protein PV09_05369 [Verruconis gallopava]|uniref:Bystin n=1 Tax=Verruconis gallopava TaxID=253628 RepID=A0A0D1YSL7_9PEZI|nr:uncharacterized protein PV09_05369 [Verruconis gallopava]KIW03617.1 hypothetical protein PV09_05369 [Verruconis gallopava]
MPKVPRPAQPDARHNPLAEDYSPVQKFKQKAPKKRNRRDENGESEVIGTKASRKILRIGQELADEDEEERKSRYVTSSNPAFSFDSRFEGDVQSEDEDDQAQWEDEEPFGDDLDQMIEEEVDVKDLEAFNRFNPPTLDDSIIRGLGGDNDGTSAKEGNIQGAGGSRNLADIILAKIEEFEANGGKPSADLDGPAFMEDDEVELPPMAVDVYTQVGLILSRYKSGKLPKPFKLLPSLPPSMLAHIIPLTRPETWTPNAIYQATRLFVSSKSAVSQGFLGGVLLDRVRDDINENKKLNVHLYNALKKALYKPKEFFRGFLFPLVEDNCTLREAHIVASVLARVSVPVLHSAYALARLCEIAAEQMTVHTEAGGATNIFIKTLLEKRYALPYQTVDALVFHFLRFKMPAPGQMDVSDTSSIEGRLPVIWHQCLLAFAQRYRDEITEDQREALLDLLLVRGHKDIGPEVRRELIKGRGRGVVLEQQDNSKADVNGGDDTMMD